MKIRRRKKRRFVYKNETIAGLIIIMAALLLFFGIKAFQNRAVAVATVSVNSVEMRQDEEIPNLQVSAFCEEDEADVVLDSKSGYTLGDLIADFNAGKGYLIEYEADVSEEGEYKLSVKLDEEIEKKLSSDWQKKLNIVFEEGVLKVKSKYGDWEGTKFKLVDGTYAGGWMNVGKSTYYFDEDGNYVTGECKIENRVYYFGEDGKFDDEKNEINPNRPMVALTFDDGPGPYTDTLLEALEEYGAKATFFMLGTRVSTYPETVKKMVEIGCELGNHTTNHARLTDLSVSEIKQEISKTNKVIKKATGQNAKYVRPPYGDVNSVVRTTVEYPLILWSLDTLDWQSKNVKKVKEVVHETIKDGDIILMHDIHETTVQAVIELLPELIEEGYQFLTVSELAEVRGVEMENGVKYFNFY